MSDTAPASVTVVEEASSLQASFVPGSGMLCCSIRRGEQELLDTREGVSAYAARGRTMGVPLLYPWANRLAGFSYRVADREVTVPRDPALVALDANGLPIHGVIGGRIPWALAGTAPAGGGSLVAGLRWDRSRPDLFEVFPFEHQVRYEAALSRGGLNISVTVLASGPDPVPVAFGFHPYISLHGAPRESWMVELPAMRRLVLDSSQIPTGAGEANSERRFALADETFDDGFDSLAVPASFAAEGAGRRIELTLEEGYGFAQVYAPPGSPFICFEPMTAPANALCSGDGLRVLAPGEEHRATFSLTVGE